MTPVKRPVTTMQMDSNDKLATLAASDFYDYGIREQIQSTYDEILSSTTQWYQLYKEKLKEHCQLKDKMSSYTNMKPSIGAIIGTIKYLIKLIQEQVNQDFKSYFVNLHIPKTINQDLLHHLQNNRIIDEMLQIICSSERSSSNSRRRPDFSTEYSIAAKELIEKIDKLEIYKISTNRWNDKIEYRYNEKLLFRHPKKVIVEESKLGEGACGVVKIQDTVDKNFFYVKKSIFPDSITRILIEPESIKKLADIRAKFSQEKLGLLLVPVAKYSFKNNAYRLISEYGGNAIFDIQGPLHETIPSRAVYELAAQIDKMHSLNIFHRDIKPENIGFLDNRLYLFDWDFSIIEGPCGTIDYIPLPILDKIKYGRYNIDYKNYNSNQVPDLSNLEKKLVDQYGFLLSFCRKEAPLKARRDNYYNREFAYIDITKESDIKQLLSTYIVEDKVQEVFEFLVSCFKKRNPKTLTALAPYFKQH